MLNVGGFQQPKHVHIHGFSTVNGEKMSKKRGTFILASKYLEKIKSQFTLLLRKTFKYLR